ncbi:hypothetical protein [Paraconexibacter sp.]|uniref:hypothetical protein n=1 Tax=Paraconexibacter sp. TaxID=2949640 RepID=UPI00356A5366
MGVLHIASGEGIHWLHLITIPIFTGVIGWLINWSGVIMLFNPVRFHGFTIPGLRAVSTLLPRKLQEVPGIMQGGVGWQGIVPARAAKMGSIATDKAIAKLGTPAEFYQQLEPDQIANHIVTMFEPEIPGIVDRVMTREHPQLWADVPPAVRAGVYDRVRQQLPTIVKQITDEIGEHIDQLLDPKIMIIDHFEKHPALVNRIFKDVGQRELNLMVNFGALFGFVLGIPVALMDFTFHQWWLLPILGVIVGWTTNLLGMSLIFEPVEEKRVWGIKLHGLFLRRQNEVADVYAGIIADDVVTLENIGNFLLNGPRGDRTRQMLVEAMGPAIDRAAGPLRGAVRVAVGGREYDAIRRSVAEESVGFTMAPFQDPEFSKRQAKRIEALIAARTREMPPSDFVEMLRSAIKEDEWMLYVHGAVMGAAGGAIHLAIFGTYAA